MTSDEKILSDWGSTDMSFPWIMFKFIRENHIQISSTNKHICSDFILKLRVLQQKQRELRQKQIDADAHWFAVEDDINALYRNWQNALCAVSGRNFKPKPVIRKWRFMEGTWKQINS